MQTQLTETIVEQLRRCNDAFEAAFAKQDGAALAALYTEDPLLLPPNSSELSTRQAIGQFWQGAMQMGIAKVTLTTLEAEEREDTAIERGHYVLRSASGDQIDHGKYMVIWKRSREQWYLHRDIWNTSQSPG